MATTLGAGPARAQDGAGPSAADGASATGPRERRTARVVLVGRAGADPELSALLGELLGRQGVTSEITRTPRFDAEALFGNDADGTLRVFVLASGAREARLYFRGPNGERYLLRTLALPSGLDAVGRELVGQVVESSAGALFESSEGLSREQASEALAREPRPEVSPAGPRDHDLPRAPPTKKPTARVDEERTGARLEPRFGVTYGASWLGTDLGVRHGPGVALGLTWRRPLWLAADLALERAFEQRFAAPGLDGRVQASLGALCLGGGVAFGHSSTLGLFLGPYAELRRLAAVALAPDVQATSATSKLRGGARMELRYAWATGHLELGAALRLELPFAHTHYDVSESAGPREVASVALVRPGGALFVAVH